MSYLIKLDAFEGPLDLLLHLIKKMEIDIYDIPIAQITHQYLQYIHTMKELELDHASEYLVMSATLLSIKSKMLLPPRTEEEDEESDFEESDPRTELVEQLIEYNQYKEAALVFEQKVSDRQEIFTRPPSDLSHFPKTVIYKDDSVTVYDMLAAYKAMLKKKKLREPLDTKVKRSKVTVEQRMDELRGYFSRRNRISFFSLFPYDDKTYLIVTFLAILELMKTDEISVEQNQHFEEIYISAREEMPALETS